MEHKRQSALLGLGWACFEAAAFGRTEHHPAAQIYPPNVVRRVKFKAGGGHDWTLSALETPRDAVTPWKIVVITGAPSWAEYWAPTLAALAQDRHMLVVDRPGFAASEPSSCVLDIRVQAEALAPLLDGPPEQQILLVGQSYGAAIATLMAANHPKKVTSLVLLSSFLGETGPTARWLVETGRRFLSLIPRDLRHAILEVSGQADQLSYMHEALKQLPMPVHVIHGDSDDFAPVEAAERLASEAATLRPIRFERVAGGDHFLNEGPAERLLTCLETCMPQPEPKPARRWLSLPRLNWPSIFAHADDRQTLEA